ncbi:TetR family transcriptional regulator [Oerskovia turbata]|uniref:TetR family transcriptional regulator n=1 Tax=Oerskovia turbata TaxID=1713 RepID=A0A4Q1L1X5_9CELL|nr:TetR/AcrR family transcriptional regulator C-terminal domain-containing protein [Oerskovia turbata]RXR26219.1 TetR family transcriptional regulator [Oerskovia turbata]RXR36721.1 TetR family transcriptional regulator [Oerskovia turbata]TGJ97407.1 TetR family transcriptional regulator [Actinotalea fermentans ATCC 43279 = JCM 9966 = DSM 3133]
MAERLDRERVVRAALTLLDEVGLDGLTLRRLAQDLGVKAPALYWHVASKTDLLHEMAVTMLRDLVDGDEWSEATVAGMPWPDCVRDSASSLRRMLLAHRDGARVFGGTLVTDEALRDAVECPMGVLTSAGFTPDDAAHAWGTVLSFVLGSVVEEQAVGRSVAAGGAGGTDRPEGTGGAPGADGFDERFAFGADVIVAGLAARLR